MTTQDSGPMTDMMRAISRLPEAEREAIIRDRLEMYAELDDDDDRSAGMAEMVSALVALSDEDRRVMVKSRTEVLFDLDEKTRTKLMATHMAVLQGLGAEAMAQDMVMFKQIIPQLSPEKQAAARMMLEHMATAKM